MDAKTRSRIEEVMGLHGHSLADVALWLKRVAPDIQTTAERDYVRGMNDLLGGLVGRSAPEEEKTPIPYADASDGIGQDMHLFLGVSGVTLEDIADYVSERTGEIRQAEQNKTHAISQMLHAMPTEATGAVEIFERSKAHAEAAKGFNASDFLCNLPYSQ